MGAFLQYTVIGLTVGSFYALVALGYTIVYGIIRLINFAQGDLSMIGAFLGWTLLVSYGVQYLPLFPALVIAFVVPMIGTALVNLAILEVAYKPLLNRSLLAILISALGMSLVLSNGAEWKWGPARLMGINVNQVIRLAFVIGAMLAAASGVMLGLYYVQIQFTLGFLLGLRAFTAAVLGGIGNIPGAMAGGMLIGLLESYTTGYISGKWEDVIVFGVLITVLIIKPTGLFGERVAVRM